MRYASFGQDLMDDAEDYGKKIAQEIISSKGSIREPLASDLSHPQRIYDLIKENDHSLKIMEVDTLAGIKKPVAEISKEDGSWNIKGCLKLEESSLPRNFKTTKPSKFIELARSNFESHFVGSIKSSLASMERKIVERQKSLNEEKVKFSKDELKSFEEMGRKAYKKKMTRIPTLDKNLVKVLKEKKLKPGQGIPIYKAWFRGWDTENLKDYKKIMKEEVFCNESDSRLEEAKGTIVLQNLTTLIDWILSDAKPESIKSLAKKIDGQIDRGKRKSNIIKA